MISCPYAHLAKDTECSDRISIGSMSRRVQAKSKSPSGREISRHLTKPVIPYVTEGVERHAELIAAASVIFIGGGELAELPGLMGRLKRPPFANSPVLLHIDLVNGLANDESGLNYVATLERALATAAPAGLRWQVVARTDLSHATIYRAVAPLALPALYPPE